MTDVFVSTDRITLDPAREFVSELRSRGLEVFHSPPWGAEAIWHTAWDSRWDNWYGANLQRSMDAASIIVAIVSEQSQISSWMLTEWESANRADRRAGFTKALLWNPDEIPVTNANYSDLIRVELPHRLDEAISTLVLRLKSAKKSTTPK